jgi:hypothetical protein
MPLPAWVQDFKKPTFIVAISISLCFGIASFCYFKINQKRMEIAYTISDTSKIYDSHKFISDKTFRMNPDDQTLKEQPPFIVLGADGHPITNDIYLTTFIFWNSGDFKIEPSEVRTPITISFAPNISILDTTIVKQSDPQSGAFQISKVKNGQQAALQIRWLHFDQRDGLRLQIIYTSPNDPRYGVSAKIAGLDRIYRIGQSEGLT